MTSHSGWEAQVSYYCRLLQAASHINVGYTTIHFHFTASPIDPERKRQWIKKIPTVIKLFSWLKPYYLQLMLKFSLLLAHDTV